MVEHGSVDFNNSSWRCWCLQRLETHSLRLRPALPGLNWLTDTGTTPALLASSSVLTRFLFLCVFVSLHSSPVSAPLLNYLKIPAIFKLKDARQMGYINAEVTFCVSLSLEANIPMIHPHLYEKGFKYMILKNIHTRLPLIKMGQW